MHDALLALPFGLAIGILLGLVGGGGSILAVPVLVYILGEPVERATTESLLVVGVTALVGAVAAARAERVRIQLALAFAGAGAAGAVAGTALNRLAGERAILLGFVPLLLLAAYAMIRGRPTADAGDDGNPTNWGRVGIAGAAVIALTSAVALAAHLATGSINASLTAAFTIAAIAGAVTGTRLHGRRPEPRLRQLFALLLSVVAAFVLAATA